jgi:hypothetical protein
MPQTPGPLTLLAYVVAAPFLLLRDIARLLLAFNRWRMRRRSLPPVLRNRSRAVAASFSLAGLADLVAQLRVLTGQGLSELLTLFWRTPLNPPPLLVILTAASALTLLFFIVGILGARGGPRDPIAALMALAIAGGFGALLWSDSYLPADFGDAARFGNPILHAFYAASVAAALMHAWLAAPLFGGSARRLINRLIRRRNAPLRPAQPRRRGRLSLALLAAGAALAALTLLVL